MLPFCKNQNLKTTAFWLNLVIPEYFGILVDEYIKIKTNF